MRDLFKYSKAILFDEVNARITKTDSVWHLADLWKCLGLKPKVYKAVVVPALLCACVLTPCQKDACETSTGINTLPLTSE